MVDSRRERVGVPSTGAWCPVCAICRGFRGHLKYVGLGSDVAEPGPSTTSCVVRAHSGALGLGLCRDQWALIVLVYRKPSAGYL